MTDPGPSRDDRSPVAKAISKATEITTVSFMMVVPILLGYWLDLYLGTVPLFAILGLVLGMSGGIWQLIKLVNRQSSESSPASRGDSGSSDQGHSRDE
ncbi:MAG: AtpZ/AtpI family protein [Pirellulaceae bacterium]